jgi:hypothetical protein
MSRDKGRLPPFVALLKDTLNSPAWRAMSHGARSLYVALKWNYNSQTHNNGRIYLSVRKAAREIGSDIKQVLRWYRELQHYGFIVMVKPGYLGVDGKGQAPRWRLTECGTKAKDGTLVPPTRDFLYWNGVRFGSPQKQNPVGEITNTPLVKSPTPPLVKSPTPKGPTVGEFTNKGTGQTVGEITNKSSLTTGYGSGGVLSERERARTLPLVTVIEGGKSPHCVHCGGSDEPLFRFRNGSRPVWLHRRCRRYWRQVREAVS